MIRSWILQTTFRAKLQWECGLLCSNSASNLSKPKRSTVRLLQQKRLLTSSGPFQPELTSIRYPQVKRKSYAEITADDISYFKNLLKIDGRVLTNETDDLSTYNTDWLRTVRGNSQIVLRPKTTEEVSSVLKYCNEKRLAVVPQGGNTGLVGGSVPVFDEIVLSTQLMDSVVSVDEISGVLVCQAGCILEKLDSAVAEYNLMMPLDLGAKGSCHIGGNVSTNAGGIRLLRYGSLHGSVLGIEAVLANGEIIDCLSSLRKDNTGYDLKQLFIGSEGTLGVVTAVSILCPRRPNAVNVALLGCESFARVLQTFREAKGKLAEVLSAYEFFDSGSKQVVQSNLKLDNPIGDYPFYVLLETSGSNGSHDEEKLTVFLEDVMSSGTVLDGTMATESSKIKYMWSLREHIAEALLHDGYCYKLDVSLPLDRFYELVEVMRERLHPLATRVVGYGHVGDGNLHFNVTSSVYNPELKALIEPFIYEYVSQCSGSISAEHGLGFAKNNYIHFSKKEPTIGLMKQIKSLMDPRGILNPYKTLPLHG